MSTPVYIRVYVGLCVCFFCSEVRAACGSDDALNELMLWHGTSKAVAQIICNTGFDTRVSNRCVRVLSVRGTMTAALVVHAMKAYASILFCFAILKNSVNDVSDTLAFLPQH